MTIHTNRWWPDTCGCCIEYEWDDQDDPNTRVHTGKRVHKACAAHPAKPAHEHFATLQDENKRKNKLLQLAMEAFPTILGEQVTTDSGTVTMPNGKEFNWRYDANRVLIVTIPKLNKTRKEQVQSVANTVFGTGKVIIE